MIPCLARNERKQACYSYHYGGGGGGGHYRGALMVWILSMK